MEREKAAELKRIERIKRQVSQREIEIGEFQELARSHREKLHLLDQQIESLAKSISYNGSAQSQKECDEKNEQAFLLMEELESFELEIKEGRDFLKGAEKSLQEIALEVEQATDLIQIQMDGLKKQKEAALAELFPSLKELFIRLEAKLRPRETLLSWIDRDSCQNCGYIFATTFLHKIENLEAVKQCPQCKKILLPTELAGQFL